MYTQIRNSNNNIYIPFLIALVYTNNLIALVYTNNIIRPITFGKKGSVDSYGLNVRLWDSFF